MSRDLHHNVFTSHGSIPGELRVSDESKYYVVDQVWEGSQILDTKIVASYDTKAKADARAKDEKKKH